MPATTIEMTTAPLSEGFSFEIEQVTDTSATLVILGGSRVVKYDVLVWSPTQFVKNMTVVRESGSTQVEINNLRQGNNARINRFF